MHPEMSQLASYNNLAMERSRSQQVPQSMANYADGDHDVVMDDQMSTNNPADGLNRA